MEYATEAIAPHTAIFTEKCLFIANVSTCQRKKYDQ